MAVVEEDLILSLIQRDSMKIDIKPISRFDYEDLCDMMTEFARSSGVADLNKNSYDREYAKNVLLRCEKTGASFIARDENNEAIGMILSMRVQELWIPNIIRLRELAWYVREQYRNTTVGARLFATYKEMAETMRNQGKITGYTMTKLHNSDDFDYEKRGFKFIESTYMVGA
jgi:GNAT superfamily N-acetyltransferase